MLDVVGITEDVLELVTRSASVTSVDVLCAFFRVFAVVAMLVSMSGILEDELGYCDINILALPVGNTEEECDSKVVTIVSELVTAIAEKVLGAVIIASVLVCIAGCAVKEVPVLIVEISEIEVIVKLLVA